MAMCHQRGAFLYQIRPDVMPYGFLTDLEIELWEMFYTEMNKKP